MTQDPNNGDLTTRSLSELCSLLAEANLAIYQYENKKWWGRKQQTVSDKEINQWDEVSRSWNEERSKIKNQIDAVIKEVCTSGPQSQTKEKGVGSGFSFQVLPISLMIDMLTIENIKIFDLTQKDNASGVAKARARKEELERHIDSAIEQVVRTGLYDLQGEARTF